MMSIRFLDETLWAILSRKTPIVSKHTFNRHTKHKIQFNLSISVPIIRFNSWKGYILGSEGSVVHHEEVDILDVADKESLVAGGHHVLGLLVGAIASL